MNATLPTLKNRQTIIIPQGRSIGRSGEYEVVTLRGYCAENDARFRKAPGTELAESIELDKKFNRETDWVWVSEPGIFICACDCQLKRDRLEARRNAITVNVGDRVLVEGEEGVWEITQAGRWAEIKVTRVVEVPA